MICTMEQKSELRIKYVDEMINVNYEVNSTKC